MKTIECEFYKVIKVIDIPFDEKERLQMGIISLATPNGFLWLKPITEESEFESILSPDRETALEEAVKFHKQVAEEAMQEQFILIQQKEQLIIENVKLRETIQELTNALSAIQHERNKNELH